MALIPPSFLNTVVALGRSSPDGTVQYIATGFLYGYPSGRTDENGERLYWLYLVTNRHVFEGAADRNISFQARFNKPSGSGATVYNLPLRDHDGSTRWTVHPDPDADVAALRINPDLLKADGIEFEFFAADKSTFTREQAQDVGVSEGDGIFVLGFPLGQAGDERNYAIVRQGIIARVQDWIAGDASTFLIDSFIFPGNSGGPVLLKPEHVSIRGTKSNSRCGVIGMISSYMPYQEIAVSEQTGRRRMVFEENSGLGIVVPHDVVHSTVEAAVNKSPSTEEQSSDAAANSE